MDEFIEFRKQLKKQGNSWAIFARDEAASLGLDVRDEICGVLCRPEDRERLHDLMNCHDARMFFLAISSDGYYEVKKIYSERELSDTFDGTVLGPFTTAEGCMRFRFYLEDNNTENSPDALRKAYRDYIMKG